MALTLLSPVKKQAQQLYIAVVEQARQPFLYKEFAIPDTLDGRFDAIVLYLFLAVRRLRREPAARYLHLARLLQEAFISDMDRSIREMGVGDTGVGMRVKRMAGALAGRIRAYEAAADENAMAEALTRNVYRGAPGNTETARHLAAFMLAGIAATDQRTAAEIAAGQLSFGAYANEGSGTASSSSALRSAVKR